MRSRPIPDPPERLASEATLMEVRAAIERFTSPDWEDLEKAEKFVFRAYSHKEVKACLNDAFHDSCAYCETNNSAGAGYDVEHYRPKGGYRQDEAGGTSAMGYFWLAATWENLLPSCQRCNRPEKHKHAGEKEPRTSGKHTWFPIVDPSKRWVDHDAEDREERLLLHPYLDDPTEHLEFREEGIVAARATSDGGPSPQGEATIRILGLNRLQLVRQRNRKLKALARCVRRVNRYRGRPDRLEEYKEALEELKELLEPDSAYLGMAEQYLRIRPPR